VFSICAKGLIISLPNPVVAGTTVKSPFASYGLRVDVFNALNKTEPKPCSFNVLRLK
jgi:hypothetical protein